MTHRASAKFWHFHAWLPEEIQRLAGENFELLKTNPRHPSLRFKKVGRYWSARVGIHYRAVAVEDGNDVVWFWIGHHSKYDQIIAGADILMTGGVTNVSEGVISPEIFSVKV